MARTLDDLLWMAFRAGWLAANRAGPGGKSAEEFDKWRRETFAFGGDVTEGER